MAFTQPHILEPGGTEVSTSAGTAHRYRLPLTCFRWSHIKTLFAESFSCWNQHDAPRLGAALAFYSLFSLTPLLLFIVGIAGMVFGEQAAENQINWQVATLIGPTGAAAITGILKSTHNTTHGVLASVIALITLLFGSSGVFLELRDSLNTIWEVPAPKTAGLRSVLAIIKQRLFSYGLVLAIGFLLLISLAISAALAALGKYWATVMPLPEIILQFGNALISFAIITGLFAAIYKVMPEIEIEWRDVLLGAAVTSILFTLGKVAIGIYLGKSTFASAYGAAASIVVFTVWVYYSSMIFFFGAEFTKAFTMRYGSGPANRPGSIVESH